MKDPALLPVRPRSVLGRATRRIAAFALTVAGTAVATPAQIPAPTLTSIVTSPVALAGGDFEATATVPVNGYAYAPSWAPWSMTPFTVSPPATKAGSGIAHAGSSLFAQSAPPPSGSYVMFVEGVGTSRCNVALPPGLWRVRFQAAQRGQGTIADVQQLRVRLGGVTVFERELPSTAFVEYATLPIRLTTTATIPLAFSGLVGTGNNNIALVDSVRIEPVLDWSSATSWLDASGGSVSQPPGLNDNVRVAAGSAVALTGPSLAATVEVHGNLTAESVDCSLASEWLLVHTSGARLDIGSAEVPFAHEFVLTLRGQPGAPTIGGAGSKFLVAMDGGQIELHGLPKTSWSRLKSLSGNTVEVTDREGWAVGDQILLVATDPMSEQDGEKASQSEVCTIVGIAPTTGELTLSPAPLANHCAADPVSYSAPNGATWTVDERAEVGMLTHNVRVEGDASDSTSVLGFGAHVMMMGGASPGTGRFSHVQFRRMGQRKILGRYPLHWHMQLAAGAGQYARGCSVWESFNRALTIHGTDFVAAEDNVLFDHFGHGLFLEDGGEQHNTIAGNLVVLTRRPPAGQELLPHDNSLDELQNRSPAAFWISNPNNHFVGNVAAHTVGTGYWFAVHTHPTGASYGNPYFDVAPNLPMDPTQLPLGSFADNTAHSCKSALDVNDTIDDNRTPADPLDDDIRRNVSWDPPGAGAVLQGLRAWGCAMGIYTGVGTDNTYTDLVTFYGAILSDNERHMQLASAFPVVHSLLVENTGFGVFAPNPVPGHIPPEVIPPPGYAFTAYDGPGQLIDSHLVGFDGNQHPSANLVAISTAARRHTNHVLQGLTFASTPQVLFADFTTSLPPQAFEPNYWGIAVRGLSSILSGGLHPDRTLITNHPMMHLTNGAATPDFAVPGTSLNAWLSPYSFGHLELFHWRNEANGWQLVGGNSLPATTFLRRSFDGWPGASYAATSVDPSNLLRQLSIIIRPVNGLPNPPECLYEVQLQHPGNGTFGNRIDVVVDDLVTGDIARLLLSNQPAWNLPNVYLNDLNSPDPSTWTLLTPVSVASLGSQSVTAFARPSASTVLLRTVNPDRRHQITITW